MPHAAQANLLEDLWNKYSGEIQKRDEPARAALPTPGIIIGKPQGHDEYGFSYPWKYRSSAYEMHFEKPVELAKSVYGLALYAKDVSPTLPREKFYGGVLGFHYSARQVAGWLNETIRNHESLSQEENAFAGRMLLEGVVKIGPDGFEPGNKITHVLGASGGKKRSFAQNLRHERLHVFWDEDRAFRERQQEAWNNLSEEDKQKARQELKNYNQDNERQLIEEWAIKGAEKTNMSIK